MNIKNEEFRAVKGYDDIYEVSNPGRVKSLTRVIVKADGVKLTVKEKILKPRISTGGYSFVTLVKDTNRKNFNNHKLVAIAFLNHTPCGMKIVIDHIDNNPFNNRADNLQLISQRQNCSKDKKGGHSKYVGVTWDKSANRWKAQIDIDGKNKYLGKFTDELKAYETYQAKLKEIERLSALEIIDSIKIDRKSFKINSIN